MKVKHGLKRSQSLVKHLYLLLGLIFAESPFLTLLYFFSAILGAFFLYLVYFVYKLMIDQVVTADLTTLSGRLFWILITYLFFEYLSRFVTYTFNNYYFDYLIRIRLQNILTRRFLSKLADLDFAHLETGSTRNLISQVDNSYSTRIPEILSKINALVFNLAALIFSFLVALQFSLIYFLILGLISLPIYYLRAKYGNVAWSSYTSNAPQANILRYIRHLFIDFDNLTEIKIYGLKDHFITQTHHIQHHLLRDYEKPIRLYSLLSTASFILIPVSIYFSLLRFIHQMPLLGYTIGDFTFFLNTLFTFSGQISSTLVNAGSIYENSLYLHDYFRFQNLQNTTTPLLPLHPLPASSPHQIRFDHVSFAYQNSSNLSLKNLNLTIEPGENVALVGHNGAGKTTFTKLLLRFYDPTSGRILIDGIDLRHIPLSDWYRQLGVLFQDFAKYHFTLKDNIHFGNISSQKPLESQIHHALLQADGLPLLQALNHNYDQPLGRWFGGIELSGGQWQKVAIARALFRQAPLLILDEPTSAIDAESEAQIFNNLRHLYTHQNLLFISHRFSTVRNADKIVVLESGQIAEVGTHSQLLKNHHLYSHFFHLQRRGYQ